MSAAVTVADCPLDAALRQLASGLCTTKRLLYSSIACAWLFSKECSLVVALMSSGSCSSYMYRWEVSQSLWARFQHARYHINTAGIQPGVHLL